ncbi:MAG: DMT family protein [Bacteroidota bacterium]|nr:DMT family protein [Bacteroidota bacterium]
MKGLKTIVFLIISNSFMTMAWYGHLRFKDFSWGRNLSLFAIILISWGMAFFEYLFQVPANESGFKENGGPYTLVQLKTIQEAITLTVFIGFTLIFFKDERLAWNHLVGFALIVLAVFVIFKKW